MRFVLTFDVGHWTPGGRQAGMHAHLHHMQMLQNGAAAGGAVGGATGVLGFSHQQQAMSYPQHAGHRQVELPVHLTQSHPYPNRSFNAYQSVVSALASPVYHIVYGGASENMLPVARSYNMRIMPSVFLIHVWLMFVGDAVN